MREIKFRAYSKKWGMIYKDSRGFSIDVHAKTAWQDCADDENIELMQFTGLKDKHGAEIYEGDILSHGFWNGIKEEGPCLHSISWDEQSAQYVSTEINNEYDNIEYPFIDNLCGEVIGNIHQNPELLKCGS